MTILFIVSTVLLVAACLIQVSIRGKVQTVEKVEFDTSAYDESPVRISGLLLRPRVRGSQKLPGVVFCPGLVANKEIYLGLCRRIANLGVAVLTIDLRGHGHSGGPSSFGRSEQHDVWGAIDVLGSRDGIDPERLGVIGHSLGGIAATRAGFEQPFDRIKTVVAIYCWKGFGDAVEAVFGPPDKFVGRWWPFFGWSREFSVTDRHAVEERSVIERISHEAGTAYLLLVGSRDPLTDMTRLQEIIGKAAGQESPEPAVTYGRFADRSARRLEVIRGANHFSVLSRRRTFAVIRQWLEDSLGVQDTSAAVPTSSVSGVLRVSRRAILLLYALSVLCFAGSLIGVLAPEHGPRQIPPPCLSIPILGTTAFLLCSALAIPVARAIRLKPFTPHWGADIVSLIAASRAILYVPVLTIALAWGRRGDGLVIEALGLSPPQVYAGLVAAGALFLWIVCSWNMVARSNRFSTLWPVLRLRGFSVLLSMLFVCYLAEEALFRGMIQSQLAGGPVLEVLLSAFLYSVTASAAMTAAVWPLFPSVSYAATFRSRSIPLLPVVFVFAFAVFSVHGLAAALLYHFTGTVVAPALFLALLVSFLFTGPIGIRTY